MAAVGTAQSTASVAPQQLGTTNSGVALPTSQPSISSTLRAANRSSPRPLAVPSGLEYGAPRLRSAPASPVKVNAPPQPLVEPSNVDIELLRPEPLASPESRPRCASQIESSLSGLSLDGEHVSASFTTTSLPTAASGHAEVAAANGPRQHEDDSMEATARPPAYMAFRDSRESDGTNSTQHPPSTESSAATSASSVSGMNDNSECPPDGESSGSSILEGDFRRTPSVPQFQYHHQQQPPARVDSVSQDGQTAPTELSGTATPPVRRHLTPTSAFFQRPSIPRPQSSYSTLSDFGPRGRSPGLMPGSSHMGPPPWQARTSPDVRPSSYAELLKVPYPQPSPAPALLDNSDLRTVVGSNASLLSTQKTLEMYRANVKKTTDFSIQYSFAVFLISTAKEQGLDFSSSKARKASPLRDLESPIVESTVTSPHDLLREARQILQRLASAGYPFAQYYLADGYASGLFSKGREDYNSAFPLFAMAAKHGHAESAYRTALCYEFGWGCRRDPTKAVQYLKTAASKRHPGAMGRLGKACLSGDLGEKRYRQGVKWMKLAAESADAQYNSAPYQLGCLYETGYGPDIFQDESYAAELFTQAAELGHPEANFRLGEAYEHGRLNCPRDPALSVHCYTGAAERGHAGAMMGLCAWYMVGAPPVLEKDEEEAFEWARRSAELGESPWTLSHRRLDANEPAGFTKAQYAVGYFTEMGIGCRRDILEANVWYVKAAEGGDERAKQRIAIIQAAVSGEGSSKMSPKGTPMDVAPPLRSGKTKDDKECIVM